MPKKEMELFDTDLLEWKPVKGYKRLYEKILSYDEETGAYTRLLKFEPMAEISEVLQHEYWEEVYIIKGGLIEKRTNKAFTEGMYACRPPGMEHGPYVSPNGCITFEIRYYGFKSKEEVGKG